MESIYDAAVKEGFAIGLVEGKAEVLSDALQHKFGPLPEQYREQIAAAGPQEIKQWLQRSNNESSLDRVFNENGEARDKAEMFLVFARRKFKQVPEEWAEQVRSAAPEQLDDWLLQAYDTDDLATVFNGSAVNGRGPAQKKPNGTP